MRMQTQSAGQGQPLVLVGGGLTGWLSWTAHAERLSGYRRVIRPQLLCVQYGLEKRPLPPGYSVKMESAALAAALEEEGLRGPADLVAWSYGALCTLDYALDHPERVRTLVLIEPPAFWALEALPGAMDERARKERDESLAMHLRMEGDVSEDQLADFVAWASISPPNKDPRRLPMWSIWAAHRRSLLNGPALFAHKDSADRLRRFDPPVLLVKGSDSTYIFHRVIDTLGAALPHAKVLELPGGHAVHMSSMESLLAQVGAFQEAGALYEMAPAP